MEETWSAKEPPKGRLAALYHYLRRRAREKRLLNEICRTLLTAGVLICIIGIMTLAQVFSDRWFDMYSRSLMLTNGGNTTTPPIFNSTLIAQRYGDHSAIFATDPLFDHVFSMLPNKSAWRGWLPDLLLTSFLVISLVVTLLLPTKKRIRFQSIVVGRRLMWTLSLLYLFRTVSFLVTTVPSPLYQCVPKYPQDPTAYLLFIGKMATGKMTACTDNIYSGHTALVTVLFFMNLTYSGRWYFVMYSFVHASAVLFTILLTRLHYSVDILIALFMTSFVWCTYHFLLLIFTDQQLLRGRDITHEKLQMAADDPRLLDERRLIMRITNWTMIEVLVWMDGMDLRTGALSAGNVDKRPPFRTADDGAGIADVTDATDVTGVTGSTSIAGIFPCQHRHGAGEKASHPMNARSILSA